MTDKYRMTGTKLLWHLNRLNDWKSGKKISPLHIELGMTTGCNLKCRFCYGQFIGQTEIENKYDMPLNTAINLFKDAKKIGVKSITLIGEGENTIHPQLYEALEVARKIKLDLAIATNGIALKNDKIKEFLESFIWIRISLCASTKESYRYIHGMDSFDRVINNIRDLVEMKNKHNLGTTIGIQMVVTDDNKNEIVDIAKLGKDLNVDYCVIKPCSDTPDKQLKHRYMDYSDVKEQLKVAEKFNDDNYSVIVKWDKLSNKGLNKFKVCYGTQFTIAIDAHGNVAPCGHLLGYRREEFNMGNINTTSFRDIVQSDRYWEIQEKVQKLNVDEECESNCLHNGMNIFLDSLKNPPDHINFP